MKVSVQYAEAHLSQLIAAAESGELVEIDRPDKPAICLVLRAGQTHMPEPSSRHLRRFGEWEGKVNLPSDEDWRTMDKEIESDMIDGPILPADVA